MTTFTENPRIPEPFVSSSGETCTPSDTITVNELNPLVDAETFAITGV